MSLSYLREAVELMIHHGFAVNESSIDLGTTPNGAVQGVRFELERGGDERVIFEAIASPSSNGESKGEQYYVELASFHGLRMRSFALDSWKVWPDRIELKLGASPEHDIIAAPSLELRFS